MFLVLFIILGLLSHNVPDIMFHFGFGCNYFIFVILNKYCLMNIFLYLIVACGCICTWFARSVTVGFYEGIMGFLWYSPGTIRDFYAL